MSGRLNILITAGGTREPIDDVRFVTNLSTGATGAALAQALSRRGHRIVLLRGEGSVAPEGAVESEVFGSAADLGARLARRLGSGEYDAVVMAAAVADYTPAEVRAGKIRSDADELVLRLVRTPKLLPSLKAMAKGRLVVVGFKLTSGATGREMQEAVDKLWQAGGIDAVVQNDLAQIRRMPEHPFELYRSREAAPERMYGAAGLALALEALIEGRLGGPIS